MPETQSMMTDSYIGGIGHVSFVPPTVGDSETVSNVSEAKPSKIAFREPREKSWKGERVLSPSALEPVFNQTDEDKLITITSDSTDEAKQSRKSTNINLTEEYNVGYTGLSILPWENFVMSPRVFNDLFYAEKTQKITYDPDEVNVFFHGKNVLPPTVGDISENGKSWNIVVNSTGELREVRACLTERPSVFGVTILYKESKFSKSERAPCLVMLDPLKSNLGEQLYTVLTRAMDSMHVERRFCIEINLNGCVERWCRRVLLTECKAVGAKLIITNGEEYAQTNRTNNMACCVACFPVWLLRTGIYKLHRMVVYDDFLVRLDGEDMFLHGAFQDPTCQRHKIFTSEEDEVFRLQSVDQTDEKTLENLGLHKFLCVKKYDRNGCMLSEDGEFTMQEYKTIAFNEFVDKRKERVLSKEKKASAKTNAKRKNKENVDDIQASGRKVRFDLNQTKIKLSAKNDSNEIEVHDNTAFQDSDNETDSLKALPVLTSSYDLTETDTTDAVDVSESTGSFFSSQSNHVSPRLKTKTSLAKTDKEHDNGETNTTNIKSFNESDVSENDELSGEEEGDLTNLGVQSNESLTGEMKRINQTLPNTEASNKKYRAKDLEEVKNTDQYIKIDQKKFNNGKSKDKTNIKHVLKDLMKTTKGEPNAKLLSAQETNSAEAQSKASDKETGVKKTDSKTNNTETTKFNSGAAGKKHVDVNDSMEANSKSVTETKLPVATASESKEHMQTESEIDPIGTQSEDIMKFRPGKKGDTNVNHFQLEESSSDGDDVEMIYQSDKVKQERTEIYQLNTESDDEKEENQITYLKPILKPPKGHVPKSDSPKMHRKFTKEVSKSGTPVRTSKEFKMPDDLVLEENEDDVWNSLRSSQIIPLTVTDSTGSMKSVFTDNDSVEKDIAVLDWEADVNESSTPKANFDSNPNSTHSKSIGENLAAKKKKRGVNRLDSSRKYLGANVPHKTKKIAK